MELLRIGIFARGVISLGDLYGEKGSFGFDGEPCIPSFPLPSISSCCPWDDWSLVKLSGQSPDDTRSLRVGTRTSVVALVRRLGMLLLTMQIWWLFPYVRSFGKKVRRIISRLRFFVVVEMEISPRAPIPLFKAKEQSTVAQRAEMTVDEHSLTSCL